MTIAEKAVGERRPSVVNLVIDDREVEAEKGMTVLQSALLAGIYIPHLCWHPAIKPYAGCRLCLVEIEKRRGMDTACTIPVSEGMVVRTNTPSVIKMRQNVLEMLLSDHPDRCLNCPRIPRCHPFGVCIRDQEVNDRCVFCAKNERCELQRVVDFVGIRWQRYRAPRHISPVERSNPFIDFDPSYCINCTRCTRVCDEVQGVAAIESTYRAGNLHIASAFEVTRDLSNCEFCGQCVQVCPTAALTDHQSKYDGLPDVAVPTTCSFCGCGCQLLLNIKGGQISSSYPTERGINGMSLCVKGRYGYDYVQSQHRLSRPLKRAADGSQLTVTWEEAIGFVASKMTEVLERYGPEAIGVIASDKCTNEENYLLQRFARGVLGTNNIGHMGELCHKPTLEGLSAAWGSAAMTGPLQDIAKAGCILVVGSNTTETHPIVALQIKRAVRRSAKLILIDPRQITLSRFAYLQLRPRPGTDLALLIGLARAIQDEGLVNEAFVSERCEGFEEFKEALRDCDLTAVSEITGVKVEDILTAARIYATGGADSRYEIPLSWYGHFVEPDSRPATNSSWIIYGAGVTLGAAPRETVQTLANLAMLTGHLGQEGAGLAPLAGPNNLQGASDMGAMAEYLPGYRPINDVGACQEFASAWGCEMPIVSGLDILQMFEAARLGKLKALYIVGANPLLSLANRSCVEEGLRSLELLVVQDVFPTETAALAHVVLPACSFAEKEGTFTNTERRVQFVRQALAPLGDSRPDWWIISDLANKVLALGDGGKQSQWLSFDYLHPKDVMEEIRALVPSYRGIIYERLQVGGLQWPCPSTTDPGTATLYQETFDRGKGRFIPLRYNLGPKETNQCYPFTLLSGRTLYHYNTGAMTRNAPGLKEFRLESCLHIHPDDAALLFLKSGDKIRVISEQGEISTTAVISDSVAKGLVFMLIHYGDTPVNVLTGRSRSLLRHSLEMRTVLVRIEKMMG
ncbi:MAG: molybdopterin-dependent oxidoreductase [Chloroflexi bacterium]|nr:molybdopterin-dependent oxidoreductase [Chloroflexota bacterium]MCL5075030.1 molybdopterin-dependent oxidoreductase [Chloroflexota bacterium]